MFNVCPYFLYLIYTFILGTKLSQIFECHYMFSTYIYDWQNLNHISCVFKTLHTHLPLDVISLLHHIEPNPSWRHLLLGNHQYISKKEPWVHRQTDTHDVHTNTQIERVLVCRQPRIHPLTHTLETSICHHRPQNKPQD